MIQDFSPHQSTGTLRLDPFLARNRRLAGATFDGTAYPSVDLNAVISALKSTTYENEYATRELAQVTTAIDSAVKSTSSVSELTLAFALLPRGTFTYPLTAGSPANQLPFGRVGDPLGQSGIPILLEEYDPSKATKFYHTSSMHRAFMTMLSESPSWLRVLLNRSRIGNMSVAKSVSHELPRYCAILPIVYLAKLMLQLMETHCPDLEFNTFYATAIRRVLDLPIPKFMEDGLPAFKDPGVLAKAHPGMRELIVFPKLAEAIAELRGIYADPSIASRIGLEPAVFADALVIADSLFVPAFHPVMKGILLGDNSLRFSPGSIGKWTTFNDDHRHKWFGKLDTRTATFKDMMAAYIPYAITPLIERLAVIVSDETHDILAALVDASPHNWVKDIKPVACEAQPIGNYGWAAPAGDEVATYFRAGLFGSVPSANADIDPYSVRSFVTDITKLKAQQTRVITRSSDGTFKPLQPARILSLNEPRLTSLRRLRREFPIAVACNSVSRHGLTGNASLGRTVVASFVGYHTGPSGILAPMIGATPTDLLGHASVSKSQRNAKGVAGNIDSALKRLSTRRLSPNALAFTLYSMYSWVVAAAAAKYGSEDPTDFPGPVLTGLFTLAGLKAAGSPGPSLEPMGMTLSLNSSSKAIVAAFSLPKPIIGMLNDLDSEFPTLGDQFESASLQIASGTFASDAASAGAIARIKLYISGILSLTDAFKGDKDTVLNLISTYLYSFGDRSSSISEFIHEQRLAALSRRVENYYTSLPFVRPYGDSELAVEEAISRLALPASFNGEDVVLIEDPNDLKGLLRSMVYGGDRIGLLSSQRFALLMCKPIPLDVSCFVDASSSEGLSIEYATRDATTAAVVSEITDEMLLSLAVDLAEKGLVPGAYATSLDATTVKASITAGQLVPQWRRGGFAVTFFQRDSDIVGSGLHWSVIYTIAPQTFDDAELLVESEVSLGKPTVLSFAASHLRTIAEISVAKVQDALKD